MKKIFLFVSSKISSVFSALKVKFLPLKIKHFEGFGYYCHRFFVKTGLSKKLSGIKIGKFNFLNWVFHVFALFFKVLGLKKLSEKTDLIMTEKSGLNRHVLFRYLLKELFLYFFVAFLFFFFIFFVNQILLIIQKILEKKVPLWDVTRLMVYALPSIMAQSAPFATLVGFLMCLGRLVSENEILIFRASGQGYKVLLFPVVFLGAAISLGSFFVNDYLLPLGTINYNRLYRSILQSNPAVELEPNSVKKAVDKTLVIGDVKGENVSDLIFFDTGADEQQRIIVAGPSSVKKSSESGVLMALEMNDATVLLFNKAKKQNFDLLTSEKNESECV